jgi:hypothetical protein
MSISAPLITILDYKLNQFIKRLRILLVNRQSAKQMKTRIRFSLFHGLKNLEELMEAMWY